MDDILSIYWSDFNRLGIEEHIIKDLIQSFHKNGITSEYKGFNVKHLPFRIEMKKMFLMSLEVELLSPLLDELSSGDDELTIERPAEIKEVPKKIPQKIAEGTSWLEDFVEIEERKELYGRIFDFENRLRHLILSIMREKRGKKWIEHIDEREVGGWKKKMEQDKAESRNIDEHLIYYADFSDYWQIIHQFWKIFKPIFKNQSDTERELKRLNNRGRKKLMHCRAMKVKDLAASYNAIEWLSIKIDNWESYQNDKV